MKAWERRADESEQAYEAFSVYRDIVRSTAKVGQKLGKSTALIHRWSAKYDWVERARAYDNQRISDAYEDLRRASAERLSSHWQQSIKLQEMAYEALTELLQKKRGSLKSLTELYNSAVERQQMLLERVQSSPENQLKIVIEDANEKTN